ncbi:hypothetical protein EVAR_47857_1 [Eumeta japonica]|uniref:Uncharacterized protein n=1 Tax=Eumeta variegata TaxID=151549 RepID=A0A4C1XRT9_EUMVA|nr:hypothetical protein EVAR_47857_1 [Eumeta japonica]
MIVDDAMKRKLWIQKCTVACQIKASASHTTRITTRSRSLEWLGGLRRVGGRSVRPRLSRLRSRPPLVLWAATVTVLGACRHGGALRAVLDSYEEKYLLPLGGKRGPPQVQAVPQLRLRVDRSQSPSKEDKRRASSLSNEETTGSDSTIVRSDSELVTDKSMNSTKDIDIDTSQAVIASANGLRSSSAQEPATISTLVATDRITKAGSKPNPKTKVPSYIFTQRG